MQNSILLENLNREDLQSLLSEIVAKQFETFSKPKTEEKFLTRKEVAMKLHISLPTLLEYTKKGKLIGYKISGRVLYKESEVESSLQQIIIPKYRRM